MHLSYYKRPLFIVFLVYLAFLVIYIPHSIEKSRYYLKTDRIYSFCGRITSYPVKYADKYRFYFDSDSGRSFVVYSDKINDISFMDKICFNAFVRNLEDENGYSFSWKKYLFYRKIFYEIEIKEIKSVIKSKFPFNVSVKLKNNLKKLFSEYFTGDKYSLLNGILLGSKENISYSFKKALINSGSIHLLVASGSNIGFFIYIFMNVFSFLGIRRQINVILVLFLTVFYVFMVGFEPPILRSYLMVFLGFLIYFLKRNVDIFQILILSAFIILLFSPLSLYDVGFQMSFIAVYGIIVGYLNYSGFIKVKNKFLRELVFISLITVFAQLALSPVLIYNFKKISLISVLSNIFLMPLSSFIMFFSILMFISKFAFLSYVLKFLTAIFIKIVYLCAGFKYSVLYFYFPNSYFLLFYVIFVIYILHLPLLSFKDYKTILISYFIFTGLIISYNFKHRTKKLYELGYKNLKTYIFIDKYEKLNLIDPVVSADKIIALITEIGYDKIDRLFISSFKTYRTRNIKELSEVLDIENIYLPFWIEDNRYKRLFAGDKFDNVEVYFKNKYGYFNSYSSLKYCIDGVCFQ